MQIKEIEIQIQDYFKYHKNGNLDDLLRFLYNILDYKDKLNDIANDLEEITINSLKILSKQEIISWDEESENFALINEEYIKEDKKSSKIVHYPYFCNIIGTIQNIKGNSLDLEEFDFKIKELQYDKLGFNCIGKKKERNRYEYEWDFLDYNLYLDIRPTFFHIEANPTYDDMNSPYTSFIKSKIISGTSSYKKYNKLPGESGAFLLLKTLEKILKEIDDNFIIKINNFSNFERRS